jgi:hypothetical protein
MCNFIFHTVIGISILLLTEIWLSVFLNTNITIRNNPLVDFYYGGSEWNYATCSYFNSSKYVLTKWFSPKFTLHDLNQDDIYGIKHTYLQYLSNSDKQTKHLLNLINHDEITSTQYTNFTTTYCQNNITLSFTTYHTILITFKGHTNIMQVQPGDTNNLFSDLMQKGHSTIKIHYINMRCNFIKSKLLFYDVSIIMWIKDSEVLFKEDTLEILFVEYTFYIMYNNEVIGLQCFEDDTVFDS